MLLPPPLLAPLLIQNSERVPAVLRADDDNDDTAPAEAGAVAAPAGAAPTARTSGEVLVFVCVCLFALALAAPACACCAWMRERVSPIKARRISSAVCGGFFSPGAGGCVCVCVCVCVLVKGGGVGADIGGFPGPVCGVVVCVHAIAPAPGLFLRVCLHPIFCGEEG